MDLKLEKKKNEKKNTFAVKLTDKDGNFKIFDSVKAAAEYVDCNKQSLYNALCYGKKIRGCKIEKIEKKQLDNI